MRSYNHRWGRTRTLNTDAAIIDSALPINLNGPIDATSGNFLHDVNSLGPTLSLVDENFSRILVAPGLRIFRIVTTGQSTPLSEWYDQEDNEFVYLIQGTAAIQFEDGRQVKLIAGSYVYIPRKAKHRILNTSHSPPAVWLAIHHDGPTGNCFPIDSLLNIEQAISFETGQQR